MTPKSRGAHAGEVREIINKGFRRCSREMLLAALEDSGVMAGAVRTYGETLNSPQVKANDSFIAEVDGSGATALFPKPAYLLSPTSTLKPGPRQNRVTPPWSCCVRWEFLTTNSTSSSSPASSLRPCSRADGSVARVGRDAARRNVREAVRY